MRTDRGTRKSNFQSSTTQKGIWMSMPIGRSISVNNSPPPLITWGKNDGIFTVEGAELYKRDIPSAELHLLDTGHFALEEEVDRIGSLMHEFLDRTINEKKVLQGRCQEISFDFGSSPSDIAAHYR